jgi:hypothetical protein
LSPRAAYIKGLAPNGSRVSEDSVGITVIERELIIGVLGQKSSDITSGNNCKLCKSEMSN